MLGTVETYNDERGFGFIRIKDSSDSMHFSEVEGKATLRVGQHVEFDVGQGRTGKPCAVNVRVLP